MPSGRKRLALFFPNQAAASAARIFPLASLLYKHTGDAGCAEGNAQEWGCNIRDGRDASLTSMAAAAGLERRTFLRRFANATGMTPIEYCRAARIARARELLVSGNTPLKLMAQSLGYKDVASFARVFHKATGSAPGAYRKRFGLNGMSPNSFASEDESHETRRILAQRAFGRDKRRNTSQQHGDDAGETQ